MLVTFHIPGPLRAFTQGRGRVEADCTASATAAEALDALWAICPGVRYRVLDEQGRVREHLNIFVGEESIRYTGGLATPLHGARDIFIIPAVSGG